jgi:hypothetical protein
MLRDRGMVGLEGSFSGTHTFPIVFGETGSGLSGPQILAEEPMEATIGTIHALSTRAV